MKKKKLQQLRGLEEELEMLQEAEVAKRGDATGAQKVTIIQTNSSSQIYLRFSKFLVCVAARSN